MSKTFIETFTTTKKHTIFTGKNALYHALFYDQYGRLASANEIYRYKTRLDSSMSWGIKPGALSKNQVAGTEIVGYGVHSKIYTKKNSIVLSSQNNGASPLFEFAILYKGAGGKLNSLQGFIGRTFQRARDYSLWWKKNKKWGT